MQSISKQTLNRLPAYLRYLRESQKKDIENVSSTTMAENFGFNPVQVRKDLAAVSIDGGKPKTGFNIDTLIKDIEAFLGYNNANEAILVGVGRLGNALLGYNGFDNYGLNIVASFDAKSDIMSVDSRGKPIYNVNKMPEMVKRMGIKMGIITVPISSAQQVCDLMVSSGIRAIWNFSPIHLKVPNNIAIKNEDMAASLAVLSNELQQILFEEE
ncbi:MAG: redox-sensing transcriptional repressor Rex [Clostridia bacterium]